MCHFWGRLFSLRKSPLLPAFYIWCRPWPLISQGWAGCSWSAFLNPKHISKVFFFLSYNENHRINPLSDIFYSDLEQRTRKYIGREASKGQESAAPIAGCKHTQRSWCTWPGSPLFTLHIPCFIGCGWSCRNSVSLIAVDWNSSSQVGWPWTSPWNPMDPGPSCVTVNTAASPF